MSLGSLTLILVSVTLSALGQVAFKFGVSSNPGQAAKELLGSFAHLLTPGVFFGLVCYGIGTILWLTALDKVELSQAYPFIGISLALTTIAGWWFFGDQITTPRIAGIALVVGGVVLLAQS